MKRISLVVLGLVASLLIWYFFLNPADYTVTFSVNTLPGTINQTLKVWNTESNAQIIEQDGLENITQQFVFNDSIHTYQWSFKAITDSSSIVKVKIKDEDHSFANRLQKYLTETDFERRSVNNTKAFFEYLKDHLALFKVTYDGEVELASTFCAYVPVTGKQGDKARGMMQNYSLLSNVLAKNEIQLNGPPFVEITDWNIQNDSIRYNFCFPIVRSEKLPEHAIVKYKRVFGKKTLKATYNGNYITSDRAWYVLLQKAKTSDLEVEMKPIEYFYNNPNMGGNELEWKAEVYMPLK